MKQKKRTTNSSSTRGGYRDKAGRKSGWKHKETCTIRIPKVFASQLVELAHQLDQVEEIDNDTISILRKNDLVTQSKLVGTDGDYPRGSAKGDREFFHSFEKEEPVDIDTKSKCLVDDTVTQSIVNSLESFTQLTKQLEKEELFDSVTKSILPINDFVTESNLTLNIQTSCSLFPDLSVALKNAKTILTAKKSARESIARLLTKLYSAQVKADDL